MGDYRVNTPNPKRKSRREPTPFATAEVLRGLATAMVFADEAVAQGTALADATSLRELQRARAWLDAAKKARGGSR